MKLLLIALFLCNVAIAADDPAATLARGQAQIQSGDFAGAATTLQAVAQREPQNGQAWYLLGYALHAAGKLDEAIPAHKKAATFPKFAPSAMYNLACAYSLEKDKDQAFLWLDKALDAGFSDSSQMGKDTDLDNIRDDPRYKVYAPDPAAYAHPFVEEDARILRVWDGENAGDQFGWVAGNCGDVDGDGANDVVVGAPSFKVKGAVCGRAYVYSGKSGALLWSATGKPGECLGFEVSDAGDQDGDGRADVFLGAPSPGGGPGHAYVHSGKDGSVIRAFAGETANDHFGEALFGAADIDGDGVHDLCIGAPLADGKNGQDCGRVQVYSGGKTEAAYTFDGNGAGDNFGSGVAASARPGHCFVAIGALNAGANQRGQVLLFPVGDSKSRAVVIDAPDPANVNFGRFFLSIPGDFDGDGIADVYSVDFESQAGAPNSGQAFIHSGKDGRLIRAFTGRPGEGLGIGNALAGDVNADGVPDLIIGAWINADAGIKSGAAYLFSGKDGSILRKWTSAIPGETFGFDATGMGDVDGDGSRDFLVTSAWSGKNGLRSGRVYLLSGAAPKR